MRAISIVLYAALFLLIVLATVDYTARIVLALLSSW
jgi:hypothetical protein